jgi:hypothetical protein
MQVIDLAELMAAAAEESEVYAKPQTARPE